MGASWGLDRGWDFACRIRGASPVFAAELWIPLAALAGHNACDGREVAASVRACPDGSIPVYVAGEARASPRDAYRSRDSSPRLPPVADPRDLIGGWRTRVPGAVWASPSGFRGLDWLHSSAGAAAGDLIIRPDHTYVWAAWGGKKGSWEAGDHDYPVVLVDGTERKRWKVGLDPKHTGGRDIMVWDGNATWYDGRR